MNVESPSGKSSGHITLRLPKALADELRRVATENDRSLSAEARLALKAWLKDYGDGREA